jgi:acetyl-CoA synthetase
MKKHGVKKGDRVTIYMPMIPEAAYAMLACTRIGAVHSSCLRRLLAGRAGRPHRRLRIDLRHHRRRGPARRQAIPLKDNTDKAIDIAAKNHVMVKNVLVVRRTGGKVGWAPGRDLWYHDEAATWTPSARREDEGGRPAVHPLHVRLDRQAEGRAAHDRRLSRLCLDDAQYVFDYHDGDIYWCTADVGWVTGHSYIVYGPLANGATTLMFEGVPNYPSPSRFWEVIDKHKVNIFYTAPTAIRALMGAGDDL